MEMSSEGGVKSERFSQASWIVKTIPRSQMTGTVDQEPGRVKKMSPMVSSKMMETA